MAKFLVVGCLIGIIIVVLLLHYLLKHRRYLQAYWLYMRSGIPIKGHRAGIDKKDLLQISKFEDKSYENIIGQERTEMGMSFILLNRKLAVDKLAVSTGEAGLKMAKDKVDSAAKLKAEVFVSAAAEYIHFADDMGNEEALFDLISKSKPDLVVKFKSTLDSFGLRNIHQIMSTYDMEENSDYIATTEPVESSCLLDYDILTLKGCTSGEQLEVCEFTIPLLQRNCLPDYYSLLQIQDMMRDLSHEKCVNQLKIILKCSKSRYVSMVTVLECLVRGEGGNQPDPLTIIRQLKAHDDFYLSLQDYKWILMALKLFPLSPIDKHTMDSFRVKYPPEADWSSDISDMIERLDLVVPQLDMSSCTSGIREENRHCNRACDILPLDDERPYLHYAAPLERSYVNATFIKGYHSPTQFVVTEWPLKHTIQAFWRMVLELGFDIVIVIGDSGNLSKLENYPDFWPEETGKTENYSHFTVENQLVENKEFHTINQLEVKDTRVSQNARLELSCTLVQIPSWPSDVEDWTEDMLRDVVKVVQDGRPVKPVYDGSAYVCVVSPDGVRKCGVLFSIWSVLDQLHALGSSGEFDVFNTMRMIKMNRPRLIDNSEEITLLYKLIHSLNENIMTSSQVQANEYNHEERSTFYNKALQLCESDAPFADDDANSSTSDSTKAQDFCPGCEERKNCAFCVDHALLRRVATSDT